MLPLAWSRVLGSVVSGSETRLPFQEVTDGPVLVMPNGGPFELVSSKLMVATDEEGVLMPMMPAWAAGAPSASTAVRTTARFPRDNVVRRGPGDLWGVMERILGGIRHWGESNGGGTSMWPGLASQRAKGTLATGSERQRAAGRSTGTMAGVNA